MIDMIDHRGDPLVRVVAAYTALLGFGLTLLIVIRSAGIGVFLAFVLPMLFAAWIAVRFGGRSVLVLAALLVGIPGVLMLIGGLGLLVLPASILFLVAAVRPMGVKGGDPWTR